MKEKPLIVIKYGGNAMTDLSLRKEVLENIISLKRIGYHIVISHGGGPYIKRILDEVNIESEFIDGQRKTTPKALKYIEMALKGQVNSDLVNELNTLGGKAVGLSGKDGQTVIAEKRKHKMLVEGRERFVDLGSVGKAVKVNRRLIDCLLENDFIPVIACIAADEKGTSYNINGDNFAGTLAGALKASQFVILTDVDGLLMDKTNPDSLIKTIDLSDVKKLKTQGIIQGGMIPKMESCEHAIIHGARSARIINGTKPGQILAIDGNTYGTIIKK